MIRIGRYDAFDKWDILCRYWRDRGSIDRQSVADPDTGRDGERVLIEWSSAARIGGTAALDEYVQLRSASPAGTGDFAGTEAIVPRLVDKIIGEGYETPFDGSPPVIARLREVFKAGALRRLRWTQNAKEIPGIAELREQANIFPTEFLAGKRRVLCIFSALFYGRADVIHIYDAVPDNAVLVDIDPRLDEMKLIYPAHWEYISADYQDFLQRAARGGEEYDLVTCDSPEALIRTVIWDHLATVMAVCRGVFIANFRSDMFDELGVSPNDRDGAARAVRNRTGIDVELREVLQRGPNYPIYWAVMQKPTGAARENSP